MSDSQPELPGLPEAPEPPELIKWFRWGLHHLRQEQAVIRRAPLAVFGAALLLSFLVWYILHERYQGEVDGLSAANVFLNATIENQKERIQGLLDALNSAGISSTATSWHLSDQQKICLLDQFKNAKEHFKGVIVFSFPEPKSQAYAGDFVNLFLRVGLGSGVIPGTTANADEVGLMVGLVDMDHPSDQAKYFMSLLNNCS